MLHIILFFSFSVFGQKNELQTWKEEREFLKYKKAEKYKGPEDWYGGYPGNMKSTDATQNQQQHSGSSGLHYNPQQLQQDRERRYKGFEKGGGDGNLKKDPEIEKPEAIELPDFEAPDVDLPDADLDIDPPTIPLGVWRFLLYLLIFTAVVVVVYLLIKNKRQKNEKIAVVDISDDWNPEQITKSELQLRLEEAMLRNDFRECVRIWFTFILKELIAGKHIRWKKDKTNHDYLNELAGKKAYLHFLKAARIYDLIWYGEYHIHEETYELLIPDLESCYETLKKGNEQ